MQVTVRKLQFLLVAVIIAFLAPSTPARAGVLIEHWATTMYSGPSEPTYGELRQEFVGTIENAQAAVDACGGMAIRLGTWSARLDTSKVGLI